MLELVKFSPLVNQWYPAKGPSGDGANTKSNYKDGWHHSAWWRQRPRLPEAGGTKVRGLSCAVLRLEGRRNLSFRMMHSCVTLWGFDFATWSKQQDLNWGLPVCVPAFLWHPAKDTNLTGTRRHKPTESLFFFLFAGLPAGTALNNSTGLQHLSKKSKGSKCIKTLD